jgi:hypothetical protein
METIFKGKVHSWDEGAGGTNGGVDIYGPINYFKQKK